MPLTSKIPVKAKFVERGKGEVVRRTPLPRTPVNKGKNKGRDCSTPRPSPLLASVLGVPRPFLTLLLFASS